MKPAREARKGGVWIVECASRETNERRRSGWIPAPLLPAYHNPRRAKEVAKARQGDSILEYRAVRYIPADANPRRSTRRKRK